MNRGIAFAGNILTDNVKNINRFPEVGMLANIASIQKAVGGSVPNTAIDLKRIDPDIPISAIGRVGNDSEGKFVVDKLLEYGINTDGVSISSKEPTGFSDVISLPAGERTFSLYRGANSGFAPSHIDIDLLECSILHMGYMYLLDKFDKEDEEFGTVIARFLKGVREHGIKTSLDLVSNNEADYSKTITVLPYLDYIIINEIEACSIFGFLPRKPDGESDIKIIKKSMEMMQQCGVHGKIIVYCKEAGFCLDCITGEFEEIPSLEIPESDIKGSVGAGDAFCAGALYGIYNHMNNKEILMFASCAAACNLFAANSTDGMKTAEEVLNMEHNYGRKKLELKGNNDGNVRYCKRLIL